MMRAALIYAAVSGTIVSAQVTRLPVPPATTAPAATAAPAGSATAAVGTVAVRTNAVAVPAIETNSAGVISVPGPGAPVLRPAANAPVAPRSNITPVQLQNINRLDIDLNGLGLPSRDINEQQRGLLETLRAAPIAQFRPSADVIARLAGTLAGAVPALNLTAQQRRQLAIDINLALNSGNLLPTESQRVLADAQSLLQRRSVVHPELVQQVMRDLNAVVSQVQTAAAKAKSPGTAPTVEAAATLPQPAPVVPAAAPGAGPAPIQAGQAGASQSGQGTGTSQPPAQVKP